MLLLQLTQVASTVDIKKNIRPSTVHGKRLRSATIPDNGNVSYGKHASPQRDPTWVMPEGAAFTPRYLQRVMSFFFEYTSEPF